MPRDSNALEIMTSVSIDFPFSSLRVDSNVRAEIDLIQRPNSHDVAVVFIPNLNPDSVKLQLAYGTPMSFTWTSWKGSETFVGYVHTSEPYTNQTARGVKITAVSAGMPLKRKSQRVFTNMTAPQVAEQLAQENGLNSDIEGHQSVWPQIPQCGNSDWELLKDLADRIGYSLRVEGVTLQFISRSKLSRYYRSMAPTLTMTETDNLSPGTTRDILEWKPSVSEHQQMGESLATHSVAGYDRASGQMVSLSSAGVDQSGRAQATPVYNNFVMQPIQSSSDAEQLVRDANEANRYSIRSQATMFGNPLLAPNRVVYISGLSDGQSGYWTVLEARHSIRAGTAYRMETTLGTEGLGDEKFNPNGPTNSGTILPASGLLKVPYATPRLTSGEHGANLARGVVQFSGGPRWTT